MGLVEEECLALKKFNITDLVQKMTLEQLEKADTICKTRGHSGNHLWYIEPFQFMVPELERLKAEK